MKPVLEALAELSSRLKDHFSDSRREAEDLLSDLLHCNRMELYSEKKTITNNEWENAQRWSERRLTGEPLPYISGKLHFAHCEFEINSTVLIPRQETEILVDKIGSCLEKEDLRGKVLWDVCCGSGAIGISLKKRFPRLTVYLSDYSLEALNLACRNARLNRVEVQALYGDLLDPFQGLKTHYLVCNPPYLSEKEYFNLDPSVKDFEPRIALVGGERGLEFYERLGQELPSYLYPKAKIWFEIGYRQGEGVFNLFKTSIWKNQKIEKDWAGHDRFFFLENE